MMTENKNLSQFTNDEADFSSDESTEDEEPSDIWTAKDEKDFLLTLSALKTGDPKIYEDGVKFFIEDKDRPNNKQNEAATGNTKMTLKDYERKLILERRGHLSEDEDEQDQHEPSYQKKDQLLKEEFKNALDSSSDESDSEGLLKKRVLTKEEKLKEDEDYYEWLKNEASTLNIHDKNLQKLKERWAKDEELEEDEKFLRDFLLYKKYEGETDENDKIPTYEEIIGEDEEEEERADEFEKKYNFRFEEPDQEFLKQYPRTSREALRKTETKRKLKRKESDKKVEKKKKKRKIELVEIPFRYRSVVPNSFGLTTEEILESDDRCLNAWAPISKMSQYRNEDEESRQVAYFERKSKSTEKKQKILQKYREEFDNKERVEDNQKAVPEEKIDDQEGPSTSSTKVESKKKKKRIWKNNLEKLKKKKKRLESGGDMDIGDLGLERMKAYGVSLKKMRRAQFSRKAEKLKKKKEEKQNPTPF